MSKVHLKLDALVKDLVEAHRELQKDYRLLLAVWFDRENERDIHLLEVFEGWPESGLGELDTFPYGPSATFPLPGRLFLTIAGPKDFKKACEQGDRLVLQARADGEVAYEETVQKYKSKVASLKKAFHG